MARTWLRGDHLLPAEDAEERFEAEKADRISRFAMGAAAIDRASGGVGQGSVRDDPGEPVRGGQLINSDDLDARFAALNNRYSE